ncbi:MAG: hypothetical protein AB7S77_22065 [Desulfatirhabdiaceae bacterium]
MIIPYMECLEKNWMTLSKRTRLCQVAPWVLLSIMPILILLTSFDSRYGFLQLIHFGQNFQDNVLPEIRDFDMPELTPYGYDGQFYAQIAVDPLLRHDGLKQATYGEGELAYRARRIGLPLLAYLLGIGQPFLILQAYALLNFLFWILLLIILNRFQNLNSAKGILLATAIMWSTGTLTSLARAVPDLPAAVFTVLALVAHSSRTSGMFLGVAALFKETAILSFPRVAWPERKDGKNTIRNFMVSAILVFAPIVIWLIYIYFQLAVTTLQQGTGNFSFPFSGVFNKVQNSIQAIATGIENRQWMALHFLFFELACPISLSIQFIFMILHVDIRSDAWKTGIGFAVLFCFLGGSVWADQYAYSRVLLPLTITFNFLICEQNQKSYFWKWYIGGNFGMSWMCFDTVARPLIAAIR